jgi:co-chaperonin GroES (HSP10)
MKLEPLGHRVLIDPEFENSQTDWGFKLDTTESWDREKYKTQIGVIVAIGATAWKDFKCEPWARVGDKVYYSKYAHKVVHDGDKEYFIVNDEDIQCRINQPDFLEE